MSFVHLLKSACYHPPKLSAAPVLPDLQLTQIHKLDPQRVANYHRLVAWRPGIAAVIHPNYVQVLSFPMQMAMMSSHPFPFKTLGLVHLANDIKINFLPEQVSVIELRTSFTKLQIHKRGYVIGVSTRAYVQDKLAIEASSDYLARSRHTHLASDSHLQDYEKTPVPNLDSAKFDTELAFASNSGRQYARVSNDFNPIHLSALSAKMFGFKRAIIHGMFSKALCVSRLISGEPARISASFLQAIYLPSAVRLSSQSVVQGQALIFALSSEQQNKQSIHLHGRIEYGVKAP